MWAPFVRSACEGNVEPINEGLNSTLMPRSIIAPLTRSHAWHAVNSRPRRWPTKGGEGIHGVPCLYLFALPVTHRVGTKEGGVHTAGESTFHVALP